jgi:hypothetical protein
VNGDVMNGSPMSRADVTLRRYAASESLARDGVEVIAVGDPDGSRFNATAWELLRVSREDPALWEDLLPPVKALRSRLLTQPQAATPNPAIAEAVEEIVKQARVLRRAVADVGLIDRLGRAALAVREPSSPLAEALADLLEQGTDAERVVVAASRAARVALASWLGDRDSPAVRVLTAGELGDVQADVARICIVGPPRFFGSSLVTAPVAGRMCFLVPSWFRDLSVPRSPFAPYAEGSIEIKAQVRNVGNRSTPEPVPVNAGPEEDLLPPSVSRTLQQPAWFATSPAARRTARDEVVAHRVLLSGGLAMWLDDGERIRGLDPSQPSGERVTSIKVREVRPGTHLLLPKGQSDQDVLRSAAYELLGERAAGVKETQEHWKQKLTDRLLQEGEDRVERDLTVLGAEHAGRVWAWTDSHLIRPRSDTDFSTLLGWLNIPVEPSFGNADLLRHATAQAGADIRGLLEQAINIADLSELDRHGHLTFDGQAEGFRSMIATRVLAIVPNVTFISRSKARVPFKDRSAQWLE